MHKQNNSTLDVFCARICMHVQDFGALMVFMMTTCQAVQELRTASGLSQQAFATRFDMSVRAIANYEKDREPNKQAVYKFAQYARELNRPDLAAVFSGRLRAETGFSVPMVERGQVSIVPGTENAHRILARLLSDPVRYPKRMKAWERIQREFVREEAEADMRVSHSFGFMREVERLASEGKTNEEISRILGCPIEASQVYFDHYRARIELEKKRAGEQK